MQTVPETGTRPDYSLIAVLPEHLGTFWPPAAEIMMKGMAREGAVPDELFPEIENALANRVAQLFVVWGPEKEPVAAFVGELLQDKNGAVVLVRGMGGARIRQWVHLHSELENWARFQGARKMVFEGPRAWGRLLDGYTMSGDGPPFLFEKGLLLQ